MSAVYTALQTNFTGADAANGLCNPALDQNPAGNGKFSNIKTVWRPKLISFVNPGSTVATFAFEYVNPMTGNIFGIDAGTVDPGNSATYGGPVGFMELATAPDGTPWLVRCVSTGADAECEFSVTYDLDTSDSETQVP